MFQHKSLLITYNIYMQLNNYHKLMYNKTGQKSWDKPTSNGYCHHCVVTGNAYRLSGTRPFVMYLRPEVALRMRELALECTHAVRGPHPGIQGFLRITAHAQNTQLVASHHLRRRPGASCLKHE